MQARSLADCLAALEGRSPGLTARLVDEAGRLRPHVRAYVDGAEVRSLRTPLVGDEEVVFESAESAAWWRARGFARFQRRARMEEEYERTYGPLAAEGPCSGEVGEGIVLTLVGGALLIWGLGSLIGLSFLPLAGTQDRVSLPVVLAVPLGLILLGWGLRDIFIDLFE
ncbi:MAG: hypothetical protein HY688_01760 [Chloroflexi bacterium]|nr:hypothetical protein [Chloroflexota bacterium]